MRKALSLLAAAVVVAPLTMVGGAAPVSAAGGVGLALQPIELVPDPNYPFVNGLSNAAAVNASGAVVGSYLTPEAEFGFLTDPSIGVIRLDALEEQTDPPIAFGLALNNSGESAGSSSVDVLFGNGDGPLLAVVWDAEGQPTSLGTIGNRTCVPFAGTVDCDDSFAHGINNTGTAVGISDRDDGSGGRISHAFADNLATLTMTDLGTLPGGTHSNATGVNDAGVVVGDSETTDGGAGLTTHAFAYDLARHTMRDLGTLPGGTSSSAAAINADGLAVGSSTVTGGATHPFVDVVARHQMKDLGLPSGATSAGATAVNGDGVVVGNSDAGPWVYEPVSKTFTLIAGAQTATGINDSGEIVGVGLLPDPEGGPNVVRGPYRTFIEPPTVVPGVGSVVEGNKGTRTLRVPVTLANTYTHTVTVQWNTLYDPAAPPGQADPGTDYTPASGTVTFAPGQTSMTVTIQVDGDTLVEPDEYVIVSFHDPTNAVMGGFYGLGFGIITNDD